MNEYFTNTSNPQPNSSGSSSLIRAEFASIKAGFDKLPTIAGNGGEFVRINAGATALETTGDVVASLTVAATGKTTPVDADLVPLVDSAASNVLKKLSWSNIKATLKTYFDALYLGITATAANASQLLGSTWASPPAIGSTTPAAGSFTTLSASGYTASSGYYINASTVLTPGATTQGTQFVTSSILQWACGAGGYSWNNNANSASLMSMTNAGAVTIPGSLSLTGGTFGYGIGAGGTVTQATSKSTAVTLNKPSGQITMDGAALGAGAEVSFTVSNSLVTIFDAVVISGDGYSGANNYDIEAKPINGGFYVYVRNKSVGSLSDAIRINFAVIKVATS